MDPSH